MGYLIGPGDVYGGDYVLYKGHDPSTTHSIGTVYVHSQHKVYCVLQLLYDII
jgi:hypothetical protein